MNGHRSHVHAGAGAKIIIQRISVGRHVGRTKIEHAQYHHRVLQPIRIGNKDRPPFTRGFGDGRQGNSSTGVYGARIS